MPLDKFKSMEHYVHVLLEIFQEKMNEIFCGFEFIRAYTNDLLITTKGDWSDHLEKLELTLQKLKDNRLKCNIEKSFLDKHKWNIYVSG